MQILPISLLCIFPIKCHSISFGKFCALLINASILLSPNFLNPYEVNISNRYNNIANYLGLDFHKITADTVDVQKHSNLAKKYIDQKILNGSDYYKNMILKMGEIEELINSL